MPPWPFSVSRGKHANSFLTLHEDCSSRKPSSAPKKIFDKVRVKGSRKLANTKFLGTGKKINCMKRNQDIQYMD
jgi:hypothetical protein